MVNNNNIIDGWAEIQQFTLCWSFAILITLQRNTESTSLAHVTDIKLVSVKFYWKFLHSTLDQSRNAPGFTKLDTAFTQTSYRQMDRVLHSYTNRNISKLITWYVLYLLPWSWQKHFQHRGRDWQPSSRSLVRCSALTPPQLLTGQRPSVFCWTNEPQPQSATLHPVWSRELYNRSYPFPGWMA